MENKGKSRARDARKSVEPQRTQILEQGVGDGGKTSGFQMSHSERLERRSSELGEAQRWGLVELAPPTRKAKPSVEGSVGRIIMQNARNDKKTQWIPSDLSIKVKQTKSDQIRPIKRSGVNQSRSGQSNKGELSKIKAD